MTAVFSNWCSTTWRDHEVRLTFTDQRQPLEPGTGFAFGNPEHEVVAEIVMTRQDFESMRGSLMGVPMPESWPPVDNKLHPMTQAELIGWARDTGLLIERQPPPVPPAPPPGPQPQGLGQLHPNLRNDY